MLALVAALLCVIANGFFVAAEFALARVRPTSLEAMARAGDREAERALSITANLDGYLTASQFGITLASLALGWLGEPALAGLIQPSLEAFGATPTVVHAVSLTFAFTIISLLHIVVGELVPKSLAIMKPAEVARATARPMIAFYVVMYPALFVLNRLSNWILHTAGLDTVSESHAIKLSPEELRLMVQTSFDAEGADGTKRELLERVLRATDRPVRAIMIPRVDMAILSLLDDFDTWMAEIRRSGYSRYPVSESRDPDRLTGYVYVKDILLAERRPRAGVSALKRDVLLVPEMTSVGDVLTRFQRSGIPLAIVIDEYGGTSGLVTVEDVVEELVGDIQDELDAEEPQLQVRDDGSLIVAGTLPVGDVPLDDLHFDEEHQGETIGALVLSELGRLARPGDRIRFGEYEATVEDVRRRRINRVVLKKQPATTFPPPPHSNVAESDPKDD